MRRLAVTAKLKAGSEERALALIKKGPPFDPSSAGFERHAVYLGNDEAVFVFEGADVERIVDTIVNDPVVSAAFSAWGDLLDGTPTLAQPVYHWEKSNGHGVLHWDEGWGE